MLSFLFSDAPWRYYLRQEPDAAIPHVRIRAGGRPRGRFLPRHVHGFGSEAFAIGSETLNVELYSGASAD